MKAVRVPSGRQRGSSLIEVLVTLLILMLGLLGLVGLMVTSQRSQLESYQRVQAMLILQDMVNRINTNRKAAACYAITTGTDGTPYLGTDYTDTPVCNTGSADQKARAISDLLEWSNLLKGSAELSNGNQVGAMLGARGCISVATVASYQVYTVSIAWQGNGKTLAPASNLPCAAGLFGDEALRRVVSVPVLIHNAI